MPWAILFMLRRTMQCRRQTVALITWLSAACSPPPTPDYRGEFARLPLWSFDSVPQLVIGSVDGPDALVGPTDAVSLSDGRIVVSDWGAYQLRCYSPEGELLWTSGQRGGGPGEFQSLAWGGLENVGDTLVVWDSEQRRLTWVAADGKLVGSTTYRGPGYAHMPMLLATGSKAIIHFGRYTFPRNRYGLVRDTADIVSLVRSADSTSTLFSLPGQEYAIVEGLRGGPGAWTARGRGVLGAGADGTMYVGVTDSPVIRKYDEHGRLTGAIRWKARIVPVDDSVKQEMLAWADTLPSAARIKQRIETEFKRKQVAPSLPVYSRVIIDRHGNVWVRPHDPYPKTKTYWLIFAPDGAPTARGLLPPYTTEIGTDYVLARWLDEDDVPFVRRHRLVKAGTD